MSLPRSYKRPILFAIARDEHTIFVSWNIDWSSVFDQAAPLDRQVHLRLLAANGSEQHRFTVEPMLGSFYLPVSRLRSTHHVELGYVTLDRGWKCVAVSEPVVLPVRARSENTQVEFATVSFHISFQKMIDLLSLTNREGLMTGLSRLESRLVASAERCADVPPADREILCALDLSIEDLRSGRVGSAERSNELRLYERVEPILDFGPTSPTSGFDASR